MADITNSVFEDFAGAASAIIREAYTPLFPSLLLGLMQGPIRQRLSRNGNFVQGGNKAVLTFDTQESFGFTPVPRFGITPAGGTSGAVASSFALTRMMAGVQWEEDDILSARTSTSLVRDLVARKMDSLVRAWAAQDKVMVHGPSSGYIGRAYSISGTTVTLRHSGNTSSQLWYDNEKDCNRLFSDNMFVQVYNGTTKVGNPVFVDFIEYLSPTIKLSADPGVADGYYFMPADSLGINDGYNLFGPGLLDAIDDGNTFQGINRSNYPRFRAYVKDGSAVASGAINFTQLSSFFYALGSRLGKPMPSEAFANYEVLDRYYQVAIRGRQTYMDPAPEKTDFDGWSAIRINKTMLIEDNELPVDRVVCPDFEQLSIQEAGKPQSVDGVNRIPSKMVMEYLEKYRGLLTGLNMRTSGVLEGLSLTA